MGRPTLALAMDFEMQVMIGHVNAVATVHFSNFSSQLPAVRPRPEFVDRPCEGCEGDESGARGVITPGRKGHEYPFQRLLVHLNK